jgi:hypothetical protein
MHADANTPAGPPGSVARSAQRLRPSLGKREVGSRINSFEACSAFTLVSACMFAKSPKATLYTGGFGGFVTSPTAPIATGRSDQLPGGFRTHWKTPLLHGARLPIAYPDGVKA